MKVNLSKIDNEYMGIFGFSWPEKIGKFMIDHLKGTPYQKQLKDFWGPMQRNVRLIKNLHNQYMALMASGYKPVDFKITPDLKGVGGEFDAATVKLASLIAQKTKVALPIINSFFRALFVLSRSGKIPMEKWNPKGFAKATTLRKKFTTERGLFEAAKTTADYAKILMLIAALGAGGYFLSQMKGFKNAETKN